MYTHERVPHQGYATVPVTADRIPVYQRGGSIVPRKERVRRSSPLMHHDPVTLLVAPDSSGSASGTLYADDGHSYDYRSGKSVYVRFELTGNSRLIARQLHTPGYESRSWLERVVVLGWTRGEVKSVTLKTASGEERSLQAKTDAAAKTLTIRKPGVNIADEWEIVL